MKPKVVVIIRCWPCLLGLKSRIFYAVGHNQYPEKPSLKTLNQCVHAEVNASKNLQKNFKSKRKKVDLYVLRVNNSGNYKLMSKPCNNCLNTVNLTCQQKGYNLNNIIYYNRNGEIEKI